MADAKKKMSKMANKMGNYIKNLPDKVSGRGRLVPKDTYEREVSELKHGKYKGSIGWNHLRNKSKSSEGDDVRAARHHLDKLGIKHKEAYAEGASNRKGKWMIHYK